MLDEATIERIVREVIRRLLEVNPALFYESGAGDRPTGGQPGSAGGIAPRPGGFPAAASTFSSPGMAPVAMNPMGTSMLSTAPSGGYAQGRPMATPELATHHHGRVLTEYDLIMARRSGHRVLTLKRGTIVTPLAKDRARDMGIELRYRD